MVNMYMNMANVSHDTVKVSVDMVNIYMDFERAS
jgi:hypothetical protein